MAIQISKKQAAAYIRRGEHDYTLTFFDFYQTILDLHTRIEELEATIDHYRPPDPDDRPDNEHQLIDNWGL